MELRIRDSTQIIDASFAAWLTSIIKTRILGSYKKYKFDIWDKYLNDSNNVTRSNNHSCFNIINFAANNLVFTDVPGELNIYIDGNKFVPGYDRLKLSTIAKTINYGTIDIKGCPIFTDVFEYFAKNINHYVTLYYGV